MLGWMNAIICILQLAEHNVNIYYYIENPKISMSR